MPRALKAARRAGAVALTLTAVGFLSPSPAQAAVTYSTLVNGNSFQCLAIPHASGANDVVPIQWPCSDDAEQQWYLKPQADGRVTIINKNSQKCLVVGGATSGTKPIQWTCDSDNPPGQQDLWIHDSDFRLRSMYANLCLAIPNSSTTSGIEPILWTCNTNNDQTWQ
ncbi:RICIN domain-containing protein [Streptomyces sp. NPDC001002]